MAINPNIPLQVRTPQFAPTLANLVQTKTQNEQRDRQLDLQERSVATQEQALSQRANARPRPSEEQIGRAYIATGMDVDAAGRMIEQGNIRGAMELMLVAEERMANLGEDTTGLQRVMRLTNQDPEQGSRFISEQLRPMLRQVIGADEEPQESFTTENRGGVPVQVSSTTGREYPSPRLGQQPGTVVNVGDGEGAATKKFGEGVGERAGQRIAQAQQATQQNMDLDRILLAMQNGADTGLGEETILNLKNFAQSFLSMQFENVDDQEAIRTIQNEMSLRLRNPDSGLGLTGSTSNKDLQFLKDSVPGLARSEEGNILIVDFSKRKNQMAIDIANEQARIIRQNNGVVPNDLDSQLLDFANEYQFFTPRERQSLQRASLEDGNYSPPLVSSQSDFDALPAGTIYQEEEGGELFVK